MANSKSHLLYGREKYDAILNEFRQMHDEENPLALHEVLDRCRKWNYPLPDWATEALQEILVNYLTGAATKVPLARHRERLKGYIRSKTYQSIMNWMKNPRNYKMMPRSCIQRWYDDDDEFFHNPKSAERAVDYAVAALGSTFANCTHSYLMRVRYFDAAKKIDPGKLLDPAQKNDPIQNIDALRDFINRHVFFDDWDVEAKVGMRDQAGFFGPSGPPPEKIQKIIDASPKLGEK